MPSFPRSDNVYLIGDVDDKCYDSVSMINREILLLLDASTGVLTHKNQLCWESVARPLVENGAGAEL